MCSNFTTRMQEERLHDNRSCLFLLCFVFVPRVGVFRVPIDKYFPYAIALSYTGGVKQ
jgi:hypothetical protein